MIDVGQGLESWCWCTAHHSLLYDMGPAVADGYDAGERAVIPALHGLGVRHLDLAMVSHGDNDHAGGLCGGGQRLSDTPRASGSSTHGTARHVAGQQWQWDGVRFRMLHPAEGMPYLDNESSVLRIETATDSALLAGDIGQYVERKLLAEQPASRNAVVIVPHHGSAVCPDPGFVSATGARLALVSSGADNRFRHPREAVVRRWCAAGAEVLDTCAWAHCRCGLAGRACNCANAAATSHVCGMRYTARAAWAMLRA